MPRNPFKPPREREAPAAKGMGPFVNLLPPGRMVAPIEARRPTPRTIIRGNYKQPFIRDVAPPILRRP